MLFYSYFKTLVGKEVTVELKNDLAITGTLHSVDQYLNVKLNNVKVVNEAKYPHMVSFRHCAGFCAASCASSRLHAAVDGAHLPVESLHPQHTAFFLLKRFRKDTSIAAKRGSRARGCGRCQCATASSAARWCAMCSCRPAAWIRRYCTTQRGGKRAAES